MNNTLLKQSRYFLSFAALSLIGCSDSNNNKQPSTDVTPTATQISAEEFSKIDFTGTWNRSFIFDSTKEVNVKVNDVDTPALESRTDSYFDVISAEKINETSTLIKYCDSLPAKSTEISPANNIIINSTSDNSVEPSEISNTAEYYKVSDDHYRVDLYANDKLYGYFELEKYSSLLVFDFGMFNFSMTDEVDLNASEDVCGKVNLSTVTLTDSRDDSITFNPMSRHFNSYSIGAPYENSFVTLKFSFINAIDQTTYTVTQDTSTTQLPVLVKISSPEFNTSSDVDTTTVINGKGGSVTIDSISDTSVIGYYDIILENDEALTGDFSFDIE